jgi:hypothetical protein
LNSKAEVRLLQGIVSAHLENLALDRTAISRLELIPQVGKV